MTGLGGEQAALSAGAVARRLGVAVATLRSWDRRYGLGPQVRESGAHRRYSPSDLARLEAFVHLIAGGVPSAEAARVVLAGDGASAAAQAPAGRAGGGSTLPIGRSGAPSARGLARCAIRLDAPGVLDLLEAVIARDGVVAAWQEIIEPALRAVGRKWTESSGRYVEVEHLLSWCASVALHRVRPAGPVRGGPAGEKVRARPVLLACVPGEWHSLPLEALAAALTERAVPTRMLGPAVPEEALHAAMSRTGPALVVLWSQTPHTADAALLARLSLTPGARMLPAGPGWSRRHHAGISVLTSLAEAVEACDGT